MTATHLRLAAVDGVTIAPVKRPKQERDQANLAALVAVDPQAIQRLSGLLTDIESTASHVEDAMRRVFEAVCSKDMFTARAVAREALLEAGATAGLARMAAFHLAQPAKPPRHRSRKS
ncbi:hypothetical protein HPT29_028495 (plasmid) [Microvirga terrae]|uniref:Uncharacterized protein n=1 Tax=Microvirga terrae TaxID=2740529 RepID=A0ABY5S0N1_9HYPH|nr:hypothetical protein [Microvirga terrae]UVF22843.1 hypothetical protein HPT29_028495 [Microvirga terrae]